MLKLYDINSKHSISSKQIVSWFKMKGEEIDLINRDPNGVNGHVAVSCLSLIYCTIQSLLISFFFAN